MSVNLSRRRFLSVTAAVLAAGPVAASQSEAQWQGRAMGARATMRIAGISQAEAAPVFAAVEAELLRLEGVFSLFRADSQLVRLNRDGFLDAPALELLDVLSLSASLNRATDGAFDPTVQPLWQALAAGRPADMRQAATGWQHVWFDSSRAGFARSGMALTLNGIAQGYITDRIAALLRAQGLANVLVNMGEIAALGSHPRGGGWKAGVAGPDGAVQARLLLQDRALATSAAAGSLVADGQSHILDPRNGQAARPGRVASVSAPIAAVADGLSTALCLLPAGDAASVAGKFPGARLEYLV